MKEQQKSKLEKLINQATALRKLLEIKENIIQKYNWLEVTEKQINTTDYTLGDIEGGKVGGKKEAERKEMKRTYGKATGIDTNREDQIYIEQELQTRKPSHGTEQKIKTSIHGPFPSIRKEEGEGDLK